jgi:hypothetical protein
VIAKVSPGQKLRIPAEAYNAFVDAAEAYKGQSRQQQVDRNGVPLLPGVALVRNDSGSDQERFAILGLAEPLILPGDNLPGFLEHLTFAGVSPDADLHDHGFCILQEPLAAGAIGRALIAGVSPVRLDVQDEDAATAALVTGIVDSLQTDPSGTARILWKEPGLGPRWGIVHIPAGGGGAALPAGQRLDTLRLLPNEDGEVVPTFQAVLAWGQIAVRSPSHSLDGKGERSWVTPTTEDGALFDPAVADNGGYGATVGFYACEADGIDIGIEKNVGADVPGMHNPDDLEIHLRLAKRAGPGVLGVPSETEAVPTLLQVGTDLLADGAVTDAKVANVDWSKITNVPDGNGVAPTWDEITGKPVAFPPTDHAHALGGALTGTTANAQLATGAVGPTALAAGAVGAVALANGAIANAKLATDYLTIGGVDYHLGDEVTGLLTNPMTTEGDLIVGGMDGEPTRLPVNEGGSLQILTSKSGVTVLQEHVLDALEDVAIEAPEDQQVLTYDAATSQWVNRKATGGGDGHGPHPALVGRIVGKSVDNTYAITLFPEYPSLAVAWVTTATQLQGDPAATIPANTWTIAAGVRKAGQAGTAVNHYDFFIQVPVWM